MKVEEAKQWLDANQDSNQDLFAHRLKDMMERKRKEHVVNTWIKDAWPTVAIACVGILIICLLFKVIVFSDLRSTENSLRRQLGQCTATLNETAAMDARVEVLFQRYLGK